MTTYAHPLGGTICYKTKTVSVYVIKVEPRYNKPLHNKRLTITNNCLCPTNSKIQEKEP